VQHAIRPGRHACGLISSVTFASVITPQVFVASGARPDGSGLQGLAERRASTGGPGSLSGVS
jgi:hypothetical protein